LILDFLSFFKNAGLPAPHKSGDPHTKIILVLLNFVFWYKMTILIYLIPIALFLGSIGLIAFLWSLKTKQFDDLEGEANRILFDDEKNDKL